VYADTGNLAAGERVWAGPQPVSFDFSDYTDVAGRYIIERLAPGEVEVLVWSEEYVPGRSESVELKGGQTVTVPDIRLRRGGWVSGYVVAPDDAHYHKWHLTGQVSPRFEGELPGDVSVRSRGIDIYKNFEFRVGPLLPGSCTLKAEMHTYGERPQLRWAAEVKGIQVKVGEETKDVVIEVRLVNE